MHFSSVVELFELVWLFDFKWLIDNFVKVLLLWCDKVGLFLLLWRLAHILLALLLLTTKEVIVLAAY